MSGTVFILNIFQNALLVLCSIESLMLRIDIHCHIPLPKQSHLPQKIDEVC